MEEKFDFSVVDAQTDTKLEVAVLLDDGVDEIEAGAESISGDEFFDIMRKKYEK